MVDVWSDSKPMNSQFDNSKAIYAIYAIYFYLHRYRNLCNRKISLEFKRLLNSCHAQNTYTNRSDMNCLQFFFELLIFNVVSFLPPVSTHVFVTIFQHFQLSFESSAQDKYDFSPICFHCGFLGFLVLNWTSDYQWADSIQWIFFFSSSYRTKSVRQSRGKRCILIENRSYKSSLSDTFDKI